MLHDNCIIISLNLREGFSLHKLWSQKLTEPTSITFVARRRNACNYASVGHGWEQILEIKPTILSNSLSTHQSNLWDLKSMNLETQEQCFPEMIPLRCEGQLRTESSTFWQKPRECLGITSKKRTYSITLYIGDNGMGTQLLHPQSLHFTVQIHIIVCVSV